MIQNHRELIVYLMAEIKDSYDELNENQQKKVIQDEIDALTIKQLKVPKLQIKYWWAFYYLMR